MSLTSIKECIYKEQAKMIVDKLYAPLVNAFADGVKYVEYYDRIESKWIKPESVLKAKVKSLKLKKSKGTFLIYEKKVLEEFGYLNDDVFDSFQKYIDGMEYITAKDGVELDKILLKKGYQHKWNPAAAGINVSKVPGANGIYMINKYKKHAFAHELGHSLQHSLSNDKKEAWLNVFDGTSQAKITKNMGAYYRKPNELFAESVKLYMNGNTKKLNSINPAITEYFDNVFKPDKPKFGTAYKLGGISEVPYKFEEKINKYLKNYGTKYFKDLDDTTKKWTMDKVFNTIDKKGTSEDLWNKLKNNKAFTKARADTIFATEMNRSFNAGVIDRMKSEGIKQGYVKCQMDSKSCAECVALNGIIKSTKELDGLVPLHCHCRCIIIPIIEKKKRENQFGEYQQEYDKEYAYAKRYIDRNSDSPYTQQSKFFERCPNMKRRLDNWRFSSQNDSSRTLQLVEESFHKKGLYRPVRDIEGLKYKSEDVSEYVKSVAWNRAVFDKKYGAGKTIKVYRGCSLKEEEGTKYLSSPLESWTTEKPVARCFGQQTIETTISSDNVRGYKDFAGFIFNEHEIMISKEGPYDIKFISRPKLTEE